MPIEIQTTTIETAGKGVTGLQDTPALTTKEMQKKFDELPLLCVAQINNIVKDLVALAKYIDDTVIAAGNIIVPPSTALLRGDGKGGVAEAKIDNEPTADSTNILLSGSIYSALKRKISKLDTGKLLWSGSLASQEGASITVEGIQEYSIYICTLEDFAPGLAMRINDDITLVHSSAQVQSSLFASQVRKYKVIDSTLEYKESLFFRVNTGTKTISAGGTPGANLTGIYGIV